MTGAASTAVTTGTSVTMGTSGTTGNGTTTGSGTTEAATTGSVESACGDGVVEGDEACDDGPANGDTARCTAGCQLACGDGVVLPLIEQCDDGNLDNLDGCTNHCTVLCDDCPYMLVASYQRWLKFDGKTWESLHGLMWFSPAELAIMSNGLGIGVVLTDGELSYGLYYGGDSWDYQGELGIKIVSNGEYPLLNYSLVASGNVAHLFYRGIDDQYYYAAFDGKTWDPLAEPIGATSNWFGGGATLGGDAAYIFRDAEQDNALSIRLRSPVWQPTELISATSSASRPRLVALASGAELLALDQAGYSARKAGKWSAPGLVSDTQSGLVPPVLIALPDGRAVAAWTIKEELAFKILTAVYDVNGDTWTTPVFAGYTTGIPALGPGIGEADAELVAFSGLTHGSTSLWHLRLVDGVWGSSTKIADNDAAEYVGLASHP